MRTSASELEQAKRRLLRVFFGRWRCGHVIGPDLLAREDDPHRVARLCVRAVEKHVDAFDVLIDKPVESSAAGHPISDYAARATRVGTRPGCPKRTRMKKMTLKNIGPIKSAELSFGDLTVLVGPQAAGKSIALQFLKLVLDKGHVHEQLRHHGIDWSGRESDFIDVYFGEGMYGIWGASSRVEKDGKNLSMKTLARRGKPGKEHVFMIPAQRVLALRNGWPRPFTDYAPGDPFSVRDFSEKLRTLVEQEFGVKEHLFPQKGRLKNEIRQLLAEHVFGGFSLRVDKVASQKRLVLEDGAKPLPHMVWSAGQREFVPLLLGLYWLMPSVQASTRENIEWVILEELEMGLHPRAITVVLLMVLELVARGYKVCASTHAPQVLEAVWAIQQLQEANADPRALLKLFACPPAQPMQRLAQEVLDKTLKVYYFDRDAEATIDISRLDPDATNRFEARWGGLGEFSERANAVVADANTPAGVRK